MLKTNRLLNDRIYIEYISDLITEQTLSLEQFVHHKYTTRLRHCLNVSYRNYKICKFLKLDAKAAARAGLLHDFFFHERKEFNRTTDGAGHMKEHPYIALKNAEESFEITLKESDIILKHMWPVTKEKPEYIESVIITIVDKYCAVIERLRFKYKNTRI